MFMTATFCQLSMSNKQWAGMAAWKFIVTADCQCACDARLLCNVDTGGD
jgi:hypothetical protein